MRKLSRKKSNREHLVRNLATSLVLYETIDTTEAKAKETKSYLEQVIARNKTNDIAAKRRVYAKLFDKNAAAKLIKELLPRYESRQSGFIRSFRLKNRAGDNAEMMRLELIDKHVFVNENSKVVVKEAAKAEKKPTTEKKAKTKSETPAENVEVAKKENENE